MCRLMRVYEFISFLYFNAVKWKSKEKQKHTKINRNINNLEHDMIIDRHLKVFKILDIYEH